MGESWDGKGQPSADHILLRYPNLIFDYCIMMLASRSFGGDGILFIYPVQYGSHLAAHDY